MPRRKTNSEVCQEAQRLLRKRGLSKFLSVKRVYRVVKPKHTAWHVVLRHICGRDWNNPISLLRSKLSRDEYPECRQEPACLTLRSRHHEIRRRLTRGEHRQDISLDIGVSFATLRTYVSAHPSLATLLEAKQIAVIDRSLKSVRGYLGIVTPGARPDTWVTTIVRCKCVMCGDEENYSARNIFTRVQKKRERGHVCQSCSTLLSYYSESEARFLLKLYIGDRALLSNVIHRFIKIKHSAKKRKIIYDRNALFSLPKPPTHCPRCAVELKIGPGPLCLEALSVHRADAALGYVPGNLERLCDGCNSEEKHVTPKIALYATLGYILNRKLTEKQTTALREALEM